MWNERRLPRLAPEFYQGPAHVLWTHVAQDRQTGWLDSEFHGLFRETLLHTCTRYHLACARYVLMPDHIHMILIGAHPSSDQLNAIKFFRRHLPLTWQKQAHDHILRENERARGAFADACQYLRENPTRAGLIESIDAWPYAGNLIPGFPDLDQWNTETFWKCFYAYRKALEEFSGG